MPEGKAASGPFHSDASRNLSGRHGAAEQSAEPRSLNGAAHDSRGAG
jgi:hypothetical protein